MGFDGISDGWSQKKGGQKKRMVMYGRFEMGFIGSDDLEGREKIDRI